MPYLPLTLVAALTAAEPATPRPNLILIVADDCVPAMLSCYGGRTPTPHLDAVAQRGARFTRAHSVSAWCCPSRYNLLTGLFCGRNPSLLARFPGDQPYQVGQNASIWPATPTIARMLGEGGYRTGYIGKWHSNFEYAAVGVQVPEIPPGSFGDPAVEQALRERQFAWCEFYRRCAGFEEVDRAVLGNLNAGKARTNLHTQHNPEWLTEGALHFLDRTRTDQRPFLLYIANTLPHSPNPALLLEADPRITQSGTLDRLPVGHPPRSTVVERLRARGLPIGGQQVGITMLDDQMGAIQAKLDALGLSDNTVIAHVADNGLLGKASCYDSGTRSWMLLTWPKGIPAGTVVNEPTSFVDILPTFLEAARVPFPECYRPDGVSLLGATRGTPTGRDAIYMELGITRAVQQANWKYIALRYTPEQIAQMQDGRVTVALDHSGGDKQVDAEVVIPYKPGYFDPDQLYDTDADPLERRNLAGDPAHAERLAQMKAILASKLATFTRAFPLEISPFVTTPAYANLVAARRAQCEKSLARAWPTGHDWERSFVLNLLEPIEVDPNFR